METAHEFNDDTYFTEGGWFSVFFAILYQYGMEAVPDKGREGSLDKSVASAARQKEKKAAYFLMVFTHMLYVACWPGTLLCNVEKAHGREDVRVLSSVTFHQKCYTEPVLKYLLKKIDVFILLRLGKWMVRSIFSAVATINFKNGRKNNSCKTNHPITSLTIHTVLLA